MSEPIHEIGRRDSESGIMVLNPALDGLIRIAKVRPSGVPVPNPPSHRLSPFKDPSSDS
jgi:hypothetical protein